MRTRLGSRPECGRRLAAHRNDVKRHRFHTKQVHELLARLALWKQPALGDWLHALELDVRLSQLLIAHGPPYCGSCRWADRGDERSPPLVADAGFDSGRLSALHRILL